MSTDTKIMKLEGKANNDTNETPADDELAAYMKWRSRRNRKMRFAEAGRRRKESEQREREYVRGMAQSDKLKAMQNDQTTPATISVEETEARRQAHEASRHSLALEGLDEFLSVEAEERSQAWIRGEITLEDAIEQTLHDIRASAASQANAALVSVAA